MAMISNSNQHPRPIQPPLLTPAEWAKAKRLDEFRQILPEKVSTAFGAIKVRPKKVFFATQNTDEEVFIFLREHWSTNLGWMFNNIVYALIPIIVIVLLNLVNIDLIDIMGWKLYTIIMLTFYGLLLSGVVRHLIDWYFNIYIVTNERVLDYDFSSATARKGVAEIALYGVGDVKEKSVGFLPQIFNYGDVSVYSDAEKNEITFNNIPRPTYVRDKVADLARIARTHNA